LNAIQPTGPKTIPVDAVVLVDIVGGRTRIEETSRAISRDNTRWVPEFRIRTYDKKDYRTLRPAERNEPIPGPLHVAIETGNLGVEQVDSRLWPVFITHGIVPTSNALVRFDKLPTDHDPNDFRVTGPVVHERRSLVALKTDPVATTHEIWADPARHGRVYRLTRWVGGGRTPSLRLDLRYREDAGKTVLDGWTLTGYLGGQPSVMSKYRVTSVEINPPLTDAQFTIPVVDGMKVTEAEFPPRGSGLNTNVPRTRTYTVEPGGIRVPSGNSEEFRTWDGEVVTPTIWARWGWWLVGGAGAVIVIVVTAIRRNRHRALSAGATST